MIGYFKGTVLSREENIIIIDINGVGYEVAVPERLAPLLDLDSTVELHVHTEVREDSIDFYGFKNRSEKEFFKKIRGVHGIGPKTAMALMAFTPDELRDAISSEDIKMLTKVHGLGKKSAERLILEMKNKLPDSIGEDRKHVSISEEAFDALKNLGYRKKDIENVFATKPDSITQTEDLVKFFLKNV